MTADTAGNLYFVQTAGHSIPAPACASAASTPAASSTPSPADRLFSLRPMARPCKPPSTPAAIAADTHGNVAFTESLPSPRHHRCGPRSHRAIHPDHARPAPLPSPRPTARPPAMPGCSIPPASPSIAPAISSSPRPAPASSARSAPTACSPPPPAPASAALSQPASPNTTQDLAPPAGIVGRQPGPPLHARYASAIPTSLRPMAKCRPTGFPPTLGPGKIAIDSKGRVLSHEHVQPHSHLPGRQTGDHRRHALAARRPAPGLRTHLPRRHRH